MVRAKRLKWTVLPLLIMGMMMTGCFFQGEQELPVNTVEPETGVEQHVEMPSEEKEEVEEEHEEAPSQESFEPVVRYADAELNARSGGGMEFEILHTLSYGTELLVVGEEDGWSEVRIEDSTYYVSSEFLSEEKPVVRKKIVLDAGHQRKGNSAKEPNGPGSSKMKAKVSSGTRGVSTGIYEYELNLTVTLKLKEELERRGYEVILVRNSHDVDISNVERAQVANSYKADTFVRIHANGSEDSSVQGMMTICQTAGNPYNGNIHQESYRLSKEILNGMLEYTGAKSKGIWETDTMTGINWCEVPSTIVEMGFMSNRAEDELLNTSAYQMKIVLGIADGLDAYFGR